jgi:hypothetical protein
MPLFRTLEFLQPLTPSFAKAAAHKLEEVRGAPSSTGSVFIHERHEPHEMFQWLDLSRHVLSRVSSFQFHLSSFFKLP